MMVNGLLPLRRRTGRQIPPQQDCGEAGSLGRSAALPGATGTRHNCGQ